MYLWLANILSQFVIYLFILLIVSFTEQKFLILIKSNLALFPLMDCAFEVIIKNSLPNPKSCRLSLYFLLLVYIWHLSLCSILRFFCIYLTKVQFVPAFILLCMDSPFPPCPSSVACVCVAVLLDSSVTMCLSCQYHIVFNYWSFTTALKSFNMNLPILFFSELFCLSIQILESACQYIPKILRFLFGLI